MACAHLINAMIRGRFAIDEWGLVYWKVGKNKVVNKCGLNKILLIGD